MLWAHRLTGARRGTPPGVVAQWLDVGDSPARNTPATLSGREAETAGDRLNPALIEVAPMRRLAEYRGSGPTAFNRFCGVDVKEMRRGSKSVPLARATTSRGFYVADDGRATVGRDPGLPRRAHGRRPNDRRSARRGGCAGHRVTGVAPRSATRGRILVKCAGCGRASCERDGVTIRTGGENITDTSDRGFAGVVGALPSLGRPGS